MKLARLLVIFLPLLTWALSEAYLIWPEFFYFSILISLLAVFFTVYYIKQIGPKAPWWLLALLPAFFFFSISVYITLSFNPWLIQALFLVSLIFQFTYFKSLYYFWNRPDLYNAEQMKTIRSYGSFLVIFFSAASIYGLQSLLNFNAAVTVPFFALIVFITIYLNLRLDENEPKAVWQFSSLMCLVLVQMAIVFVFLPLSYNISALSISIVYYLTVNLANLYLQRALTPKKIKLYVTLSFAGLTALLFTAAWLN